MTSRNLGRVFVLWCILLTISSISAQPVINTIAGGVPLVTPALGKNVSIGFTRGLALDAGGNLYFSVSSCVFKLDTAGVITRYAGMGEFGSGGDGGPASDATLGIPTSLALDRDGNLFIADITVVRKVSSAGIITTIAGTGDVQVSQADGPARSIPLGYIGGLALDVQGNLYFGELGGARIRKVTPSGTLSTVPGTGLQATAMNGNSLAVDATGNIYVGDSQGVIWRVGANGGSVSRIAEHTTCCLFNTSTGTLFAPVIPNSIAVTANGLAVSSASGVIFQIGLNGLNPALIGSFSTSSGSGDDGPALGGLGIPNLIAGDSLGNLYYSDDGFNRIRRISTSGIATSIVGNGMFNYSGDIGPARQAQIGRPLGVKVDSSGNIFFADNKNHCVRKIAPDGTITRVAGTGVQGFSGDGGAATQATLAFPWGIGLDVQGNLYIADTGNQRVRKVTPDGIIRTIAGNNSFNSLGDGGLAAAARLDGPTDVAVDSSGQVYIADLYRVRKILLDGTITTVAGNGANGPAQDGVAATQSAVFPRYLAVDSAGNLFFSDATGTGRIRKVSNGIISTLVGGGLPIDTSLGTPYVLYDPAGIAIDASGNLIFGDWLASRIYKMTPFGALSVISGSFDTWTYLGDGGPASAATFISIAGIALDANGTIYVADSAFRSIRVITSTSISGIVNAASGLAGQVSPGEIVVLYGNGLGPATLTTAVADAKTGFATSDAGTSVYFGTTAAPVLYTSSGQVAAVVPYSVSQGRAQVTVRYNTATTAAFPVNVVPAAPGLFTADSSGKGQAAAVNQDGSFNSPSHPARGGDVVLLFATGEGLLNPPAQDGHLIGVPLSQPVLPVTVSIGGQQAQVLRGRFSRPSRGPTPDQRQSPRRAPGEFG